jgi:uncharacterized membrane protein
MPFQFTHPGYLVLLPVLAAAAWWLSRRSLANLTRTRRIVSNAVRLAVVVLLVLALAGLQVVHVSHSLCTVFVLDVSASVPAELQKAALDYVRAACKKMRRNDKAALVAFGADAYIELPPSEAPKIMRIQSRPSTNYTDLASAVRLGLASLPQDSARQIVVLSDGNENLGSALDQALACKSSGVKIHAVALRSRIKSEVMLERASMPAEAKRGEPFEMKIAAHATAPAGGRLRLFRNGSYVGERQVQLLPGKSVINVPQSIEKPGFYTYEALLDAGPDTLSENNRALGFVQVRGKPRVLVLAGSPGQAAHLARGLQDHGIDVAVQGREGIPTNLAGWQNWDAVVFSDIPAFALTPEQMLMIQTMVRDLGGGFAMVGGEDGFGAGGYFKTPIEETLPVDMAIRKQKTFPSLAVLLIMDTSGSSGQVIGGEQMIRLEAESAVQVVELMQDIDRIGVIVSGQAVDVLAPIRYARQKAALISDLSRMVPGGGGIYCRPSMQEAYELMKDVDARIKHVIMLADGGDCDEQEGCDEIAAMMKRDRITFSTVSFGLGNHTPFLQRVAKVGGGNFYLATRATDLPRIFTKDAMMASKSLIVEEQFKPKADSSAEILRGIDLGSMPPLLGYVATTPKPLASQPLITHKNDPLLATWRYGLGRSVAFTSDAQARWAAHWLGWPGYGKFWAQAVRWMIRRARPTNWQTTVEESGGQGRVTVEAMDNQGRFINFLDLEARIVKPDLKPQNIRLEQTAPGRYSGEFPVRDVGAYLVTVIPRGKTEGAGQTAGIVVPYSPDYKDLKPNEFLLNQLAETTGGRMDPAPESVYGGKRQPARSPQDVWTLLVLLAALLWPVDVAARRLAIESAQVVAAAASVRERARRAWRAVRPRRRLRPAHEPTLGRLLQDRERRKAEMPAPVIAEGALPSVTAARQEKPPAAPVGAGVSRAPSAQEPQAPKAGEGEGDALSRLKAAKERARRGGH